ncbi:MULTISPECIES: hypothetical protein [Haloferax]|uniref:Uncharacterized protein n=1 Tax=Haloferax mediterranei (strain ATCC 33500 / DSM 1411 / JCM 8866 / NBRC 14739 / NCIMB 2177 / R-4) TaxID=523841 RepID=A0A059TJC2_HALMT|nr:hypothetical protein [Haloferax mediterranei]AHZ21535.1 hypothetical protein BM92_02195 [Haloferax mediterranei ATCC 33500]MDX5989199.1 hypothetical protein [Haloferax mediterranei ATCC 33500]
MQPRFESFRRAVYAENYSRTTTKICALSSLSKVKTGLQALSTFFRLGRDEYLLGGQVKVTYNDAEYLAERHGIDGQRERLEQVNTVLESLATGDR